MINNLFLLYVLQIIFVLSYDKIKSRNEVHMSKEYMKKNEGFLAQKVA